MQVYHDGVPTAAEVEKTKLGGRKMMVSKKSKRKENMKEGASSEKDSTISGATHSAGHCNRRRRGILNVECKLRNRKPRTDRKFKMAGFTAFNADYHVPKSHPPRNN